MVYDEMAKIFIADDDPVVRHILSAMLESLGHEVSLAESGTEALSILRDLAQAGDLPEILFLDYQLTDLSGLEVLKDLRGTVSSAQLPAIMLSANTKLELLELNPEVLPELYLEKPFTQDDVACIIEEALQQRGAV